MVGSNQSYIQRRSNLTDKQADSNSTSMYVTEFEKEALMVARMNLRCGHIQSNA